MTHVGDNKNHVHENCIVNIKVTLGKLITVTKNINTLMVFCVSFDWTHDCVMSEKVAYY